MNGGISRTQRRLAQMAGVELGWRVVAGELLAWAVTALALVMSYHAEQDLGQSLPAFRGWPALLWPLSVDVADVGLMVLYLEYKRLRLTTWKVWLGMVAATAVMIAANVRSVWPEPTAVLMQAWVPAIALWLWHTLAAGRRPRGAPLDLAAVWAHMIGERVHVGESQFGAGVISSNVAQRRPAARNPRARVSARGEVRRLLGRQSAALSDEQLKTVADRIAERTGVSLAHARRLLREEQQPRVVPAHQEADR